MDAHTSIIGIKWVHQGIDNLRAPELLDKLLISKTVSPLKDLDRYMMAIKGRRILKNLAPNFDAKKDRHIEMLKNIGQHINMDGCILSSMDEHPMSRANFDSTTDIDQIYALVVSLRDAAQSNVDASALLQIIAQLFMEGVRDQEQNMCL